MAEREHDQHALRPLTERVLARLPGERRLWVAAWALVPWLNGGVNLLLDSTSKSAVWEQRGTLVVLNYAALSFAIVVAIWGSRRLAGDSGNCVVRNRSAS